MKRMCLLLLSGLAMIPAYSRGGSRLVSNLEDGRPQVLVVYGTSLTANGGWVKDLGHRFEEQFPGQMTLINSGGAGKYSQWGVEQLDRRVIGKNPDTVFIEFSINDCVARFDFSVDKARTNLVTMIDRIQKHNPQCEVILMTMTPGNKHPKGHRSYREHIEAHYEMYRSVAKQRGLLLIDHYPNWKALQEKDPKRFSTYVPDAIHPTAVACSEMVTPVILEALGCPEKSSNETE